jgi:hypothetical protein
MIHDSDKIPNPVLYTPRGHYCGFLNVLNTLYYKGLMCFCFPHP